MKPFRYVYLFFIDLLTCVIVGVGTAIELWKEIR